MTSTEIDQFLETCRWLVNHAKVDKIIQNHARGILVRIATAGKDAVK